MTSDDRLVSSEVHRPKTSDWLRHELKLSYVVGSFRVV